MYSRQQGAALKALVVVLAALTLSQTVQAQESPYLRSGLMIGLHSVGAQGIKLAGEDFNEPYELGSGFGAGVTLGYAINRTISSFVSFDVAKVKSAPDEVNEGTYGLGHIEFGVRANLPLGVTKTVPYVTGSVGRRGLAAKVTNYDTGETNDVAFHGRVMGVGGGIEHFFSPKLSLDAGVQLSFGKFDHLTYDGEDNDLVLDGTTSMRVRLGFTWRP